MRRFWQLFLALAAVFLVGALAFRTLLKTDAVWTWGGQRLVDFARSRIYGDIEVQEVRGNHLTGLQFKGLTVRGRQGEVLRAAAVEICFSLWSFVTLQPVIANLAIYDPHLTLTKDQEGRWNVTNLFRPKPPPPFSAINFSQITIKGGEITLTQAGTSQIYQHLDLLLTMTVLHPKRPQQAILVRRAVWSGDTPWGRLGLQTRVTYSPNLLNLLSLSVTAMDRPLVSLAGEVRFSETAEPLCKLLGEIGPISGEELHRFWRYWPASLDLKGKFQLTGNPSQLQISGEGPLNQAGYSYKSQAQRQAGEWIYDLDLYLKGLRPQVLVPEESQWASRLKNVPPVSAQFRFKGAGLSWPPKNFECTLLCQPFSYQAARVKQLQISFSAHGREQQLQGNLRGNFGGLFATLTGPLLSSLSGEMKIRAEGFQPRLMCLPVESGGSVSGKFSGNFRLPGALSAGPLTLAGELEARGQGEQQPLKDLRASMALTGPRLEIAQAQVRLGTLTVGLKGVVDVQGLDLQGKAALAMDGTWPLLPAGLRGWVAGEGTLKGSFATPQFTLSVQGQGLSWADFTCRKVILKAASKGWLPSAGSLEIQGSGLKTPAGVFSQASFRSEGEGGKWWLHFTASSPQGLWAEMQGTADLFAQPHLLTLQRCGLAIPKVSAVNTAAVKIRFHPGFEMAPVSWRVNDGYLTIGGQSRVNELNARLEVVDLPASLLDLTGASLEGKIQGQMDFSGNLQHPAIQGQFTWGQEKFRKFFFRSLQISINYREENLLLKGNVEEKSSGQRLVWDGRIPLRLSFSPLHWDWGERDIDFRVQGENTNLALLTALTPEVQSAGGSLMIMAQWQGNPRHPRVSGKIRWDDGTLQLRQSGRVFRLLPGEATLQGEKLLIPDIALESGGMVHIHGSITLSAFSLWQVDIRTQLQDFKGLDRGGAEATGSGTVTLTGSKSAPLVKGHLMVTKATFRPSFFQTGINKDIVLKKSPVPPTAKTPEAWEMAFWNNLRMDLTLEASADAWIIDKRLRVELAGSLKIQKHSGEPVYLVGTLHTLQGTYELQRNLFKVERGEVRFPGKTQGEVTIEGLATYNISGVALILNASGPASKPQVKLESIPPLPPPDQLAYLMFSRPAQTLSREEYLTVGQQALSILGGVTAQKVQEILGQDFPLLGNVSLKSGQFEGRQTVGIVKPLTKDITVTLERKTSPIYRDDTNQVRLEYKVNKYIGIESQMGRRNSGGDVLFNFDF